MTAIFHVLKKDLHRFRWLLLAWFGFLAARCTAITIAAGVFGAPNLALLATLQSFPGIILLHWLGPVITFFAVAALSFEDPLTGHEAFWITRPISGAQLLAAKLLGAVLAFVLPSVVCAAVWWKFCNAGWHEIAGLSGGVAIEYFLIVAAGLGVASATGGYARYLLWTIIGAATLLTTHVSVRMLLDRPLNALPAESIYFQILLACGLALSLLLMIYQYFVRFFRWSLVALGGAILATSVTLFSLDLKSPRAPNPFAPLGGEPRVAHVRVNGRPTAEEFNVILPLAWEPFPSFAVVNGVLIGNFHAADGRSWRTQSGVDGPASIRAHARALLGFPPQSSPEEWTARSYLPARAIAQVVADARTFDGKVIANCLDLSLAAEVPLAAQTITLPRGSCSISDVVLQRGELELTITYRIPPQHGVLRFSAIDYLAVVNRQTQEEFPSVKQQGLWVAFSPVFDGVFVYSSRVTFKLPPKSGLQVRSANWFDAAKLVLVGHTGGGPLTVEIPLTNLPAPPAAGDQAEKSGPPKLSDEAMHRFVGIYQVQEEPKPQVTFVLKAHRLMAQATGMADFFLEPATENTFVPRRVSAFQDAPQDVRLEFVTDDSGQVVRLLVHQRGQVYVLPKIK